jgi:hypothetical protein
MRPLLVFENIHAPARTRLFTFAGVIVEATRYAWLAVPGYIAVGVLLSVLGRFGDSVVATFGTGCALGAGLYLTNSVHSLGHIVVGRIVGSPMDVLLLTATRDVTLYASATGSPARQARILRSLGGPVFNLLAGTAAFAAAALFKSEWLRFLSLANVVVGLWTLCPVPTLDGWVIWGQLFGDRHHNA